MNFVIDLAHRRVSVARGKALERKPEGLRFDSSWGLRIFSLSHARDKTKTFLILHRAQNLPSLLFLSSNKFYVYI